MIIIGIDPGTTTTGYCVLEKIGTNYKLLDYGILKTTPKIELEFKLLEIGNDIKALLEKYKPDLLSIEKLYFTNNIKTGIDVASSRGVIIYETIKNNIKILEYTPLQVKKSVCGNGKANKKQVQNAIKIIFGLSKTPKPDDVADAIALAYIGALNV